MHFIARPISQLRLQRIHRWALLWLKWFAAFLDEAQLFAPLSKPATTIAHGWLDRLERVVFGIVLIRVAPLIRPAQRPRHSARRRKERQLVRAIMGLALRRALRPKDLRQRIAALSQDIGALVTRVLKRLPRGLTRRRPFKTRRQPRAICISAPVLCGAATADTS